MSAATIRRHVTVRGDVQGVFFRESTRRKAGEAGVAGWVTNRPDGSVEAVFEGAPDAVELLVEFAREGPTAASVDSVDVEEQSPEGLTGFDVR
jgi:acylphosphatase